MASTNIGFGFQGGGSGGGGTPGPQGTPGSVWRNGSGVPSNSLGINGDYYLDNDTGQVYQKIANVYQPVANIKGADGTNGTNGSVWYAGSGAPTPSPSFNANDFYLNNDNGDVFRYDGVAWLPETNIDGTDGTNGSVWYASSGFPPPSGTYNANDFYLDNSTSEVYQYNGTTWIPQVNINGANGSQWYTANGAPTNIYNNGDFYLDGSTGEVYQQISNAWVNTGTNIKGANGTNGTDGSIWYSGATLPPNVVGYNPTDYFLVTTNGNVYQNNGSAWVFQLTLSGVAGSSWLNGNGVPSSGLGNDGDYYLDDLTGDVYTKVSGSWGSAIANIKGPAGANGLDGQDGSSSSYFFYRTKTTITSGDPLATHVRWNQTAQTTSTELGISVETDDNVDITIFLKLLQVGDTIIIQDKDVSANFQTWEVSASITDNTTWISVPVTFINSGGTGTSNFANNLPVILAITREGVPGADGANSTRYGFDNTTVPPVQPLANTFNADSTTLANITTIGVDKDNIDNVDFYAFWSSLETWYQSAGQTQSYIQIREIGDTKVIGSYVMLDAKDFVNWFSFTIAPIAATGTLDPTKTYSLSYAVGGAVGSQGANGVNGANSINWFLNTGGASTAGFYSYSPIGTPPNLASTITSFELNDNSINGNQFDWLEFARTTSLTGAVGILSVTSVLFPDAQTNYTINSVVDNGGTHTFNVSFLGGFDLDFGSFVTADTFVFSYVFNGVGGVGGTIGVYYPNISTPIDLATNTMVFTGSGVNVTQISPSDVQIDITGNSNGSIVSSIRSLSASTTLSPFVVGAITIPYNGTITGWTIFSDVSGSCTVDFKSGTYNAYPPSTSIFSGNAPNLVSNVKNQLTGLSIAVTQGNVLLCDLTAISGAMSRIDVTLLITKS